MNRAALAASAWIPMLYLLGALISQAGTSSVDRLALDLIRQSDRRVAAVRSLKAEVRSVTHHRRAGGAVATVERTAKVWLQRPNLARIETAIRLRETQTGKWVHYPRWSTFVSDGAMTWRVEPRTRTYRVGKAAPDGRNVDLKMLPILSGYFDPEMAPGARLRFYRHHGFLISLMDLGMDSDIWDQRRIGWRYRRVGTDFHIGEEVWVDGGLFPVRFDYLSGAEGVAATTRLVNLTIDPTIDRAVFKFSPPNGYQKLKR